MKPINFHLHFSDPALAKAILESKPPKGIKISGSLNPMIRCMAGAEMVWNVNFNIDIPLFVFATWLVAILLKKKKKAGNSPNEKARINDKDVPLKRRDIILIIKDVLFYQKFREKQFRETQRRVGHNKKVNRKKKKV